MYIYIILNFFYLLFSFFPNISKTLYCLIIRNGNKVGRVRVIAPPYPTC